MRRGIERCESPLEEKLAHGFANLAGFEWRRPEDDPWEVGRWPGWLLALLAQPQYGPYRADFGISTWVHEDNEPTPFNVIIEVDGHAYHERTPEQAEYDKSRDRFMTATNANIFRFTGREVWRHAEACASEVLTYVTRIQQQHLEGKFLKFVEEQVKARSF